LDSPNNNGLNFNGVSHSIVAFDSSGLKVDQAQRNVALEVPRLKPPVTLSAQSPHVLATERTKRAIVWHQCYKTDSDVGVHKNSNNR
jgi:hypothetical protein